MHWFRKWFPAHNCYPLTPMVTKLHRHIPHDSRMFLEIFFYLFFYLFFFFFYLGGGGVICPVRTDPDLVWSNLVFILQYKFECVSDINECLVYSPCRNGATCQNLDGSYLCQCVAGWTGTDCQDGKSGVFYLCHSEVCLQTCNRLYNYYWLVSRFSWDYAGCV